MKHKDLLSRITVEPDISVSQILTALSNNVSIDDLLRDYPEVEEEEVLAVLTY